MIYGREKVEYKNNYTDTHNAIIQDTLDWTISDTLLDLTDNTTILTDQNINDPQTKVYESAGIKTVHCEVDFDDGWGNIYQHETDLEVEALVYEEPILDFNWTPLNPTMNDEVVFTQDHEDTRDDEIDEVLGRIDEVRVDFYSDGSDEVDFIDDVSNFKYQFTNGGTEIPINLKATYWDGWQYQLVNLEKILEMGNIPPIAKYTREDNGLCIPNYIWTATSTDEDGDDNNISHTWRLYDSEYNQIDTNTGKTYTYPFQFEGDYKIKLTSKDEQGATHSKEEIVTISFNSCEGGIAPIASETKALNMYFDKE